jgi:hypothetical protein
MIDGETGQRAKKVFPDDVAMHPNVRTGDIMQNAIQSEQDFAEHGQDAGKRTPCIAMVSSRLMTARAPGASPVGNSLKTDARRFRSGAFGRGCRSH